MLLNLYFLVAAAVWCAVTMVWIRDDKIPDRTAAIAAIILGLILAAVWPVFLLGVLIFKFIR